MRTSRVVVEIARRAFSEDGHGAELQEGSPLKGAEKQVARTFNGRRNGLGCREELHGFLPRRNSIPHGYALRMWGVPSIGPPYAPIRYASSEATDSIRRSGSSSPASSAHLSSASSAL